MDDAVFGGMADVQAKFTQYRINGDMLTDMSIGPAAAIMELDPVCD